MSRSRLTTLILAAVLVTAGAAFAGRALVSSSDSSSARPTQSSTAPPAQRPTPTPAPASTPDPAPPAGYVRFRNARTGYSIAYPNDWSRLPPPRDAGAQLLVAQGQATSLLVREVPVGVKVTAQTLPNVRELTDSLVRADKRVRLLGAPEPLTLGGLLGYRYRYTFAATGSQRGAHVHYFLFTGSRLITLVFQALPDTQLDADSPVFDRIAATFRGPTRR